MSSSPTDETIFAIRRPQSNLLTYYILSSLLLGPFFPVALIPRFFRYETLRYRFDDEGVSMRWGLLFRKEIHLTYSRIQDIHLRSNVIERWLGLARIEIQTASGSAKAEMTVEGILEFEAVRDFVYSRMRGLRQTEAASGSPSRYSQPAVGAMSPGSGSGGELADTLREVARELKEIRLTLARRDES